MVRLLCGQLVGDRNAHAAAGAGDHADGRLQVRRVQVGHFGAGDLLQLLLRDGRDLRLVGHAGTALDTDAKKVNVKVSMFGRETPAELDFTQVKPL